MTLTLHRAVVACFQLVHPDPFPGFVGFRHPFFRRQRQPEPFGDLHLTLGHFKTDLLTLALLRNLGHLVPSRRTVFAVQPVDSEKSTKI